VDREVRVENATVEDLPDLAALLQDLFSHEADFVPNQEKQLRGLRLILEQPSRGRIFVLRGPTGVFGMINLLITISTAEGGFVLVLEDLVVRNDHRGQGYGTQLLEHAIGFAREKGFLRITLLTDKPDVATKRFYARHGFVESGMVPMRLYLDPPQAR
jgi:GNAT superfamily N-acetyltransferase